MSINCIIIRDIADLKIVIDSPILITGDSRLQNEETTVNMWALSIDFCVTKIILVNDLADFVFSLLQKRSQQIAKQGVYHSAIFYMWFDEMAAQLRFNIVSDINQKLPFECQLEVVNSLQPILEEFLTSHYHAGIAWNELEQVEKNSDDDNEDDELFILKLFVAYIHPK